MMFGHLGGIKTSEKKKQACRLNGLKPKKKKGEEDELKS